MVFIIKDKKRDKVYHYEVTSYWDKEKKQPRQKRRYLGVEDEQGNVITPRKEVKIKNIQEYGGTYLLNELAKECGLREVLNNVYPEASDEILNLVYFKILEMAPYYLYKDWGEKTYLPYGKSFTSQEASRFMQSLGEDESRQNRFFSEWIKKHKDVGSLVFDITSISSHSKLNEWIEWGYNRDGELLPQLNLGAIVSKDLGFPLAYRFCSGSIPDVKTLKNTVIFSKELGLSKIDFVLDRGFFSENNIKEMCEAGIDFTIPISFTTKEAKGVLKRVNEKIKLPEKAFQYNKSLMYYQKDKIRIGEREFEAHVFLNSAREQDSISIFYERLFQIENKLYELKTDDKIERFFESHATYKKFFDISNGTIKRNNEKISEHCIGMGKMVLITSKPNQKPERLLDIYVKKDIVEKSFDNMKNDLDENRLRVSSRESFSGRLFITFLSLILRMYLSTKSNKSELSKNLTIPEIFSKLKLIRRIQTQSGYYITEISKIQKNIFEKLGIQIPS